MAQYSAVRPSHTARAALVCLAFAVALVLAERYVRLRGADTDFFPRWYGLRALLLEGRDPYAAAVTAEITAQTSLSAAPDAARAAYGFVYPLPGALLIAPFSLLPYSWAAAVWLTVGLGALPASLLLVIRARGAPLKAATALSACLLAWGSVPSLWNLALVQPGLLVVPLLAVAIWLAPRRPGTAGVCLACAAWLKPQVAAPLAVAWALFGVATGHLAASRRLVGGLVASSSVLAALATTFLPVWPTSWIDALGAYSRVPTMRSLSPAVFQLAELLGAPPTTAAVVTVLVALALGAWVLRGWRTAAQTLGIPLGVPSSGRWGSMSRSTPGSSPGIPWAGMSRTVVAGALLVPPPWETNALVLLLPIAVTAGTLSRSRVSLWQVALLYLAVTLALAPLPLLLPWRSGAVTVAVYAALWAAVSSRLRPPAADRSAAAPDAA